MGADMLIEYVQIAKDKDPDFAKGKAFVEEFGQKPKSEWPKDFVEFHVDEDKEDPCPSVLETFRQDIGDLEKAWAEDHNEASFLECETKRILITGGLSWGDSPTDLFRQIDRLRAAGVTVACGFEF